MNNPTLDLIRSHRSIRKFTDEPISDEMLNTIVAAGQCAATSSNIQAITVIEVGDRQVRERLSEVAGGQAYVREAARFLVWCADLARPAAACEAAGGRFEPGMTEHFLIASVDVALAAQTSVLAAESLGLGICYIGALRNDPVEVVRLLELPEQVYPVFGLCLGWPDQDPEVKPRLPLEVVLKRERYTSAEDAALIASYDETMREYYRTRTGGTKDSAWSEEMAALVGKEGRPHMQGFVQSQGFARR